MSQFSSAQQIKSAFECLEVVQQVAGQAPASLQPEMEAAFETLSTALEKLRGVEEGPPPESSETKAGVDERADQLQHYDDLLDYISDAIIASDKNYVIRSWNRAAERIYGYPAGEVVGRPVREVLQTDYLDQSAAVVRETFLKYGQWRGEVIQKHKSGTSIYVQSSVTALRDRVGQILGAVGVNRDITKLKAAEEAYRTLVEHSLQGLAIIQDFQIAFANSALVRLTGYTAAELKSMSPDEVRAMVHPEDWASVWNRADERLSGKPAPATYKFRFLRKNGEIRWVEINATRIEYRGRAAIQVAVIDITPRIRAEESLRETETLHQIILSNMSDAVFITEDSGLFVYICPNVANIFGYSLEEVQALGHIKNLLGGALVDHQALASAGEIENIEHQITDKDGQPHDLLVNVKYASIRGGTMLYTCRDVTAYKGAERALRESEALNRAILSSLTTHIAVLAKDGAIIAVNDAWERFARDNGAEANAYTGVGSNYLATCRRAVDEDGEAADTAQKALTGIQAVLDGTESRFTLEYPCHSPTEKRWFLLLATPLKNGHSGAVLSHLNITERKQAEIEKARLLEAVSAQSQQLRALSARLAETEEAERKQLALELHDRVGQNLTALSLNLSLIRGALDDVLPRSDEVKLHLDDSAVLVDEIGERIRDVMGSLHPPMLDDYGLVAALDWYGSRFAKWANLNVLVRGSEPDPRLAPSVESALFRIAQEALTNVARHAQASQVVVRVESSNGLTRLVIADDGVGFEPAGLAGFAERPSWGLLGMSERAEAVGGQCRILSRPRQGTQVIVEVGR